MLDWLVKLIPQEYKVGVAIKKISYTVAKLAIAGIMYGKAKTLVGDNLTPDQVTQIQAAVAGATAALLTGVQDWAKVKYPNLAQWL